MTEGRQQQIGPDTDAGARWVGRGREQIERPFTGAQGQCIAHTPEPHHQHPDTGIIPRSGALAGTRSQQDYSKVGIQGRGHLIETVAEVPQRRIHRGQSRKEACSRGGNGASLVPGPAEIPHSRHPKLLLEADTQRGVGRHGLDGRGMCQQAGRAGPDRQETGHSQAQ
ncbi:hypothetical protein H696_05105 [Fonticula alba]|uniref:Uncharacterized protein n=1 Tax=Fonticula alba TaxID=691883 RepID=A0A058Z212_FONAL|nr:hypothetical protein H696_05105 [Fonticula alba]KCV68176.1 hypothetical protein H696_05105 [Fonticula alba]|eukprot:XP_009497230.1 hypothetical protein H696_05105 [Fonticula alba]